VECAIESRHSIEDDRRTEPENARLCDERQTLLDQIEAAPELSTLAAAMAMARAAMADCEVDLTGHWQARDDSEWLALLAVEFLATGAIV
jgi:hypothetical protein